MIYSTSAILAQERYGEGTFFLKRELLWVSCGMISLYIGYRIPYRLWAKISTWLLLLAGALLLLVMVPSIGHEVGGARRWIKLGSFGFQPSELVKYAVIIFLAKWLADHQDHIKSFTRGFLPPIVILGFFVGLILIQPDLGTSLALGIIGLILLFVGGVRVRYLLSLFFISLPVLYFFIADVPYRRARILAFLDPWKDPKGVGFQIIQSFIALGSGGWTGVGLGESRQKLFYLPEAHTDFIFSIIGEELGFIGAIIVCLAFFFLFILGFRVVLKINDLTGHLMGLGIVSLLALQTLVNIGVVTGSLPTKGLPLPFISFGGSSLVLSMAGIGILMNLAMSAARENDFEASWRRPRKGRVKVKGGQKIFEGTRRSKKK
jgi:cell division protein FtsW